MTNWHRIVLVLSALSTVAGQARADYISGVTIEDVSSEGVADDRGADRVLDGSGLVGVAHGAEPNGTMWNTIDGLAPRITFDLEDVYNVASLHVWNYNGNTFNGILRSERGIKDLVISTSVDGAVYTALGQFTFAQAPGDDGYLGETIDLGGVDARYVRFDVLSNYSPQGFAYDTGLSEVRFTAAATAVPEPASLAMLGSGLAGTAARMRRRRARTA